MTEMTEMAGMDRYGWKLLEVNLNGWNGWKLLGNAGNGWKGLKMA